MKQIKKTVSENWEDKYRKKITGLIYSWTIDPVFTSEELDGLVEALMKDIIKPERKNLLNEVREEIMKCIPEEAQKYWMGAKGFNQCRQEILDNLKDIGLGVNK